MPVRLAFKWANTLFIQIGVEETTQGLNVIIRDNGFARLRELLFINSLPPLQRRTHRGIIVFHDGQFNRRTVQHPSASASFCCALAELRWRWLGRRCRQTRLPSCSFHALSATCSTSFGTASWLTSAAQLSRSTASSASLAASSGVFSCSSAFSALWAWRLRLCSLPPPSSPSSDRPLSWPGPAPARPRPDEPGRAR